MSVGAGVINVALSIILVQRVGVTGVTLGTLIATSLVTLIFVMPYVLRVIGLRSFWWAVQGCWCTRCSILAWGRASSGASQALVIGDGIQLQDQHEALLGIFVSSYIRCTAVISLTEVNASINRR